MANDQDKQGGIPELSTPQLIKLALEVGFQPIVAVLLLAALMGWVPSPLMTAISELKYQGWQNGVVLRALCNNLAINETQKWRCEPWKENAGQ